MTFQALRNSEIDREKWDACVDRDSESLIYFNSFYLDVVSPNWSALVHGDYEAVFPLPVRKKWSLSYIAHPLFCQQLGLVGQGANERIYQVSLREINRKYRRYLVRTTPRFSSGNSKCSKRLNLVLDLSSDKVSEAYNQNTKRNLKKFSSAGIEVKKRISIDDFMALKKSSSRAQLSKEEWERMEDLIETCSDHEVGFFRGVFIEDVLVSAVFFSKWKGRICYLFSASNEKGMEVRSSFGIVHDVITEFQGKDLILDFEGSMDENVARFFRGFGAKEEWYYEYQRAF